MLTSRVLILSVILILSVVSSAHPGGKKKHSKFDMLDKLQRNIDSMKGLLTRQERRIVVGIEQLQFRMESLDHLANKVEEKIVEGRENKTNCTTPTAPVNGHILGLSSDTNGAGELTGSRLFFVCNDGFHLNGAETRTCLSDGSWTGEEATCVDMTTLLKHQIIACADLDCQNGGVCSRIPGSEKFSCKCPKQFGGRKCETRQSSLTGNVRLSRCITRGEKKVCKCDPGFKKGGNQVLCFDIDECSNWPQTATDVIPHDVGLLTKRHAISKVIDRACRHTCVNTPGSFRCTCPPGYASDHTGRDCLDIDECMAGNHNCTSGQHCFNTGGSHKCVRVNCPRSYAVTSSFVCQKIPCRNMKCQKLPVTITHHYVDLPANLTYPVEIFRTKADASASTNLNRFSIGSAAHRNWFVAKKLDPLTGALILLRPLDDVREHVVNFEIRETTRGRRHRLVARYVYRVTAFSSPYTF